MTRAIDVEALLKRKGNKAAEELAARAPRDTVMLVGLMKHVTSPVKRVKNGAAKTLKIVSEENPELLVSHLREFVQLMDSEDTIVRWISMDVVGNLAKLDRHGVVDGKVVQVFLKRISDPSLVTASHAVDNLGCIALHKPRLRARITKALVQADAVDRAPDCREILAGKVLTTISEYVDEVSSRPARESIGQYAAQHVESHRPATGRKAEKLITRLG